MVLPKHYGTTTTIFEYLFRRPKSVSSTWGTNPYQSIHIDTPYLERKRMRNIRRLNQHNSLLIR